jgi:hypothetical protein
VPSLATLLRSKLAQASTPVALTNKVKFLALHAECIFEHGNQLFRDIFIGSFEG